MTVGELWDKFKELDKLEAIARQRRQAIAHYADIDLPYLLATEKAKLKETEELLAIRRSEVIQ